MTITTQGKPHSLVVLFGIDQSMMLLRSPTYIDAKQLAQQTDQPKMNDPFYNNHLIFLPDSKIKDIDFPYYNEKPQYRGKTGNLQTGLEESSARIGNEFAETLWDAQTSDA